MIEQIKSTDYHEGKIYDVVREYEVNITTDEFDNPINEYIFIREISKVEIKIETIESLKQEIEDLKSRLTTVEEK